MAKLILVICLSFLFASCQVPDCQSQGSSTQKATTDGTTAVAACPVPDDGQGSDPSTTPTNPLPDGDVPTEALIFDANIQYFNFPKDSEDKVLKAIDIIKKVIASSEFRSKVLNFSYNGQTQFVDNQGLSNEEVYQKLLDGSETLTPELDHEMDLELELYYSYKNTVGYTYANVLRIYLNTKYFNPYTPAEVAGNIFHEWTHKLGFEHASSYSVSRDYSVPYGLGYLMRDLGKQYE